MGLRPKKQGGGRGAGGCGAFLGPQPAGRRAPPLNPWERDRCGTVSEETGDRVAPLNPWERDRYSVRGSCRAYRAARLAPCGSVWDYAQEEEHPLV